MFSQLYCDCFTGAVHLGKQTPEPAGYIPLANATGGISHLYGERAASHLYFSYGKACTGSR